MEITEAIRKFILDYEVDMENNVESIKLEIDPKAEIYWMKDTSLKYSEWYQAEKIANYLTEDLWDAVQNFPFGTKLSS